VLIISSIWSNPLDQFISTQNNVLTRVTLRFIALDLMSYFNSTKIKWNFIYCDYFTLKRENSPDFLCMNAMHTSVSSIFVTPLPGILQSLPLKLNFVLEVWTLSRFRSVDLTCADYNISRIPYWSYWISLNISLVQILPGIHYCLSLSHGFLTSIPWFLLIS
jgi:hypothetical protein